MLSWSHSDSLGMSLRSTDNACLASSLGAISDLMAPPGTHSSTERNDVLLPSAVHQASGVNALTRASFVGLKQLILLWCMQHEKFQSAPGSRVGTPAYLAPEVIMTTKGTTYDGKVWPW